MADQPDSKADAAAVTDSDWAAFQPVPAGWPAPYAQGSTSPGFADLLSGIPMALALLDSSGRMFAGNEALAATAGDAWRPGMLPQDLVVPDSQRPLRHAIANVLTGGNGRTLRVALLNRPDDVQDVRVIPFPPGLGAAAMLALRDIREQVRLERQVAAATRMQAVGQLAGGIAHDFNNLLTGILGMVDQMLETDRTAPVDRTGLEEIRRNAHRGARLVAQLLAFARQQPQRRHLFCARDLVHDLQPLLHKLLGPAVELDVDRRPGRFLLKADPGQLEQVIVNLAINARDAMAGQGRLRIVYHDVPARDVPALGHDIMPAMDYVGIELTDTGTGIPPEIIGKIFEPFFTTKPQGQGTGLGLSTVYGIVKQSDGYIFAAPGPDGIGTRFSVYLPGHPASEKTASTASVPPPAPTATLDQPLNVLLVEDEPSVRLVLARGLERKGCIVTTAEDAAAALRVITTDHPIDVLLSDVMMPGMDGVELAVQTVKLRPGIGLVLMSGYAELPRHREADALGVRFLSKPFTMSDLLAALSKAGARTA
ncbi:MAG: response regulator [Alphaproteobacteria bacterium]|nr:response regulator [Alphaproteobacteria bacterium]